MRYSDVFVKKSSRILLGTAYFGDGIDERTAFEIMDKYCDMGGTHIDTARLYAGGVAEEIVGRWVRSRGAHHIQVSTKGAYPHADAPDVSRLTETEIRSDVEASLKATGFDAFDFYWLHQDDENVPAGEMVELMDTLMSEGKIVAYGVSNWTSERVDEAQRYAAAHGLAGISASQIRFNPAVMNTENNEGRFDRLVGMDKTEFNYYRESKLPVVAYSSQAKGFFSKMATLGADALSPKARGRYLNDDNLKTLDVLTALAEEHSCSVAAVICGAFCSFDTPEIFPVIGGRNLDQITDSMMGADVSVTEEEIARIFHTLF